MTTMSTLALPACDACLLEDLGLMFAGLEKEGVEGAAHVAGLCDSMAAWFHASDPRPQPPDFDFQDALRLLSDWLEYGDDLDRQMASRLRALPGRFVERWHAIH